MLQFDTSFNSTCLSYVFLGPTHVISGFIITPLLRANMTCYRGEIAHLQNKHAREVRQKIEVTMEVKYRKESNLESCVSSMHSMFLGC